MQANKLEQQKSFKNDPCVVEKTREAAFFWLEPGIGVIFLGAILERDKALRVLHWVMSLGSGIFLSSVPGRASKVASLALVLSALRPFGDGRYFRFVFGMATVMRVLRVLEVLRDPHYFEERGPMYTIKFCFLYHDLRRATCFAKPSEKKEAERQAIKDAAANAAIILAMTLLLRVELVKQHIFSLSFTNLMRFYSFTRFVEAGYRLHLSLFGIRAPACFDDPWSSVTIGEFWGKRWNLAIAQQLRNLVFKPVIELTGDRRLAELGIFAASSALHMIPVVALGGSPKAIASTALFFLIQPGLIAFEKMNHLKGVAWVQGALWACSPLFSLPLYEVL